MAKGNLFLGFARGSVGDVTLYRTNGEQVSRARNRHPSNPRTDAQLYQRALLATISRVYQLGRAIFNHSFQGYRRGAENQRRFQKLNLNALRAQLAADMQAGTALARVTAPGVTAPTANRYVISAGTYDNTLLTPAADGSVTLPAIVSGETIAQYAQRVGLVDGDIYTVVAIGMSSTDFAYEFIDDEGQLVEPASVGRAVFKYFQLRVKEGVQANTAYIDADTKLYDLFDIFQLSNITDADTLLSSPILFADIIENPDWNQGTVGVIRSREDSDLRSNTVMQFVGTPSFGITAPWLLEVWRRESSIGGATDILEGSNFDGAGGSLVPSLVRVLYANCQEEISGVYQKWQPVMVMSNGSTFTPVIAVPDTDYPTRTNYYTLVIALLHDDQKAGMGTDNFGVNDWVFQLGSEEMEDYTTATVAASDGSVREDVGNIGFPAGYKVVGTLEQFNFSAIAEQLTALTEGKFVYHTR